MTDAPTSGTGQYFGKDLEAMSFARNYHEWILAELRPYIGRDVAEVGAGVGSFSKLLLTSPLESLDAFEPSDNMYPLLASTLRHESRAHPVHGFFGDDSETTRYDSILYINVLEHIEDDLKELKRASAALKTGGHLLIFVPALKWLYSDLDRQVGHFRRYHKRDLVRLVEGTGLRLVKARYFDIAGILPWYVNFVLLKNSITSGGVSAYDRIVVPVMRIVERVLPVPIGKNVLLVGRKI